VVDPFINSFQQNDVVRLQALIDRKMVIITEDFIRQSLRLDDADSVDCLPIEEIFAALARMGVGKGFSRVDTPLFSGMLVPQQAQDVEDVAEDKDAVNEVTAESTSPTCATLTKQVANLEQDKIAQAIEITKIKQRVKRIHLNERGITELDADEDITLEEVDAEITKDADETDEAELAEVEEVLEVVTAAKLMTGVVTTATTITAALVHKASAPRRRRGVIIQDPEEAATASLTMQSEVKSKDKGKGILVEEPKPLKRQARQALIEQDEAFTRELEAKLNANINWNEVIEQGKRKGRQDNTVMRYQALKRKPVTKAKEKKNMMVYLKNMAGFKMDFFKEESETSLELLRLMRRQQQEGYKPE
nr:hypothetical protein [Tanacetum cinerariifolium]